MRAFTWYNDKEFFLRSSERREKQILWVGRLESPKDPLLALEVLSELLRRTRQDWQLVMIGDGSLLSQVDASVRSRNLEERVRLLGAMTRAEVAAQLEQSTALLMTSRFEGSPVVLYEAMAVGTPVVASPNADPDQVIVHGLNGMRCEDSASGLADGLSNLRALSPEEIARSVAHRSMAQSVPRIWAATR
ncbi:glycosyltransferase [Microbacterium sp. NPDC055312]